MVGGATKPSAAPWENEAGKCGQAAVLCSSVSRQLAQSGAESTTSPSSSDRCEAVTLATARLVNSRIAPSSPRVTIVSLMSVPSSMFAAREAGESTGSAGGK